MKFHDRIRRIEEKFLPAIKVDGKKVIPPLLVCILVSAVVDPVTGNRRPSTLEESEHAKVDGKVVDREPGEPPLEQITSLAGTGADERVKRRCASPIAQESAPASQASIN